MVLLDKVLDLHGVEQGYGMDVEGAEGEWDGWVALDDVKGGPLPPGLVREARLKELAYLRNRCVYRYASLQDAIKAVGRRPLRLKWIDTNKGDGANYNIRSRLVCTEVRPKGTEAIFSATPPLESLRILLTIASQPIKDRADPYCISLADVSRAHFYADADREVYIQLPAEDPRSGEKDICGRLLKTMYGALDAAERL